MFVSSSHGLHFVNRKAFDPRIKRKRSGPKSSNSSSAISTLLDTPEFSYSLPESE